MIRVKFMIFTPDACWHMAAFVNTSLKTSVLCFIEGEHQTSTSRDIQREL